LAVNDRRSPCSVFSPSQPSPSVAFPADARTLRWSSQGDYLTADPMAQNELLTNSINGHVYESLVMRGKKLEILPASPRAGSRRAHHLGVQPAQGREVPRRQRLHRRRRGVLDPSGCRARPRTSASTANSVGKPTKIDTHTVQLDAGAEPVMLRCSPTASS
jgi:peptide/nickel transport system substrate-binding protein